MQELKHAKMEQLNRAYKESQYVCPPTEYYCRQEKLLAVVAELLLLEHKDLTIEEELEE